MKISYLLLLFVLNPTSATQEPDRPSSLSSALHLNPTKTEEPRKRSNLRNPSDIVFETKLTVLETPITADKVDNGSIVNLDNGQICQSNEDCISDFCNHLSVPFKCERKRKDGEGCSENNECEHGKCKQLTSPIKGCGWHGLNEGENCMQTSDCSIIDIYPLYCGVFPENTCKRKLSAGQTCGFQDHCQDGLYCGWDYKCHMKKNPGSRCFEDYECHWGCEWDWFQLKCKQCKALGEDCTASSVSNPIPTQECCLGYPQGGCVHQASSGGGKCVQFFSGKGDQGDSSD